MKKVILTLVIVIIIVILAGAYFYDRSLNTTTQEVSVNSVSTYTASAVLPGLTFNYPSKLGTPIIAHPSKVILDLKFTGGDLSASSTVLSFSEAGNNISPNQSFDDWIASNFGYVPGNSHDPQLSGDTSIATFGVYDGKQAIKIEGYANRPNSTLYYINLGNGSVLSVSITGVGLSDTQRDQLVNSIKL